jgi:hypothetical protein
MRRPVDNCCIAVEVAELAEFDAFAACNAEMFVLITVICGLQGKYLYRNDCRTGSKRNGCHTLKRQNFAAFKHWTAIICRMTEMNLFHVRSFDMPARHDDEKGPAARWRRAAGPEDPAARWRRAAG